MTEQKAMLRLEGTLTIKTATETRDRIIDAIKGARGSNLPLDIDISENCNCDLTLPQLLLAAQTEAQAERVELRIRAPEQGSFAATLKRAGFIGSGADGSILRINGDNS